MHFHRLNVYSPHDACRCSRRACYETGRDCSSRRRCAARPASISQRIDDSGIKVVPLCCLVKKTSAILFYRGKRGCLRCDAITSWETGYSTQGARAGEASVVSRNEADRSVCLLTLKAREREREIVHVWVSEKEQKKKREEETARRPG